MDIIDVSETKIVQRKDMRDIFPRDFVDKGLISKYILYAMNHFFELPEQKFVDGYIGQRLSSNTNDYYLKENDSERQAFQLVPSVVSNDEAYTFFNYKNQLKSEGANIQDENRIFSEKHWSWMPPINPDMFLNYYFYYWYQDTEVIYKLYSKTDADSYIIGQKTYTYTGKLSEEGSTETLTFEDGMKIMFMNDENSKYNNILYVVSGVSDSIELIEYSDPTVEVYDITNINKDIIGSKNYKVTIYNTETKESKEIDLINGLRIKFNNDTNKEYNGVQFIVDGVGTSISLINDENPIDISSNPSYITMERGSKDGNKWSKTNRWYHKDVLTLLDIKDFTKFKQAKKPILCFNKNMELYNYGFNDRGVADLALDRLPSEINGTEINALQNVTLVSGMTLLFLKTTENEINLYTLNIDDQTIILTPKINGSDVHGKSLIGDGVYVLSGDNASKYFYYKDNTNGTGNIWVEGQQKESDNQKILFNLYDSYKDKLDSANYPNSTFTGCSVFEFKKGETYDTDIEMYVEKDDYDNFIFNNSIETDTIKYTYSDGSETKTYQGFKYYRNFVDDTYLNDWYYNPSESSSFMFMTKQYDVDPTFSVDDDGFSYTTITLDYIPDELSNKKSFFVYMNGSVLSETYYTLDKNILKISKTSGISKGTFLKIKFYKENLYETIDNWESNKEYLKYDKVMYNNVPYQCLVDNSTSSTFNINDWGYVERKYEGIKDGYFYELPLSLSSNVDNETIEEIAYQNCLNQFKSVMENQKDFSGSVIGLNNYNNISKDLSLGDIIVQHSSPIIKSIITEKTNIGVINSIEYVKNQYINFKGKLINMIDTYSKKGKIDSDLINDSDTAKEKLIEIINLINIGKNGLEPFYNNGVASSLAENLYIPSTPAYLGIGKVFRPYFTQLDSGKYALVCHDGSYQALNQELNNNSPTDARDYLYYLFEMEIYKSMIKDSTLKDEDDEYSAKYLNTITPSSMIEYYPGYFRNSKYSEEDIVKLYQGDFHKWATRNGLDYATNSDYDSDNPFTWNYNNAQDRNGVILSGSYRKIYKHYYDTDEPQNHPWEMLGFGGEPSWWKTYYGSAPYTSYNISMWKDIENGIIRDGDSKGQYDYLKRPGLVSDYLPVDSEGKLLDPLKAGIVAIPPTQSSARSNWVIGDYGKMEYIWTKSSEYNYTMQKVNYLLRPMTWIENGWDVEHYKVLFSDSTYLQIINSSVNERLQSKDTYVHNEVVDGSYVRNIGNQQWFSDYLTYNRISITDNYGDIIRSSNSKLSYRCGAYYQKDNIKFYADAIGYIPEENIHTNLLKTLTGNVYTYSGMIITYTSKGFMIDGYDDSYPYFKVKVPNTTAKKTGVEINGKTVYYHNIWTDNINEIPYKTYYKSIQDVYDIICGYGKYLEENETWFFNTTTESGEINDFRKCAYEFFKWTTLLANHTDTEGVSILLNPGIGGMGLYHFGIIDDMNNKINGYVTMLDTNKKPISMKELDIVRNSYNSVIRTKTTGIALLKVRTLISEQINWFDNETIYGNTVYNSLLNSFVSRLKLSGIKVDGWDGTYYAPGYIISTDGAIPNFEKEIRSMNVIYDTDNLTNVGYPVELTKNMIGFKDTDYMNSLLLNSQSIFNFYKGMIREKGTTQPIEKLQKSTFVSDAKSVNSLYEMWAVKKADIGQTRENSTMEFIIDPTTITQNPQIIRFSTIERNGKENDLNISNIYYDDSNWIKKNKIKQNNRFEYKSDSITYPTAGFVNIADTTDMIIVANEEEFEKEFEDASVGQIFWIIFDTNGDWDIRKKLDTSILGIPKYTSMVVENFNKLNDIIMGRNDIDNYFSLNDIVYIRSDSYMNNKIYFTDDKFGNKKEYFVSDNETSWMTVKLSTSNDVKEFSSTKSYSQGDIVWNNYAIGNVTKYVYFKANKNVSAGSWNEADWDVIPLFTLNTIQMKSLSTKSIKSVYLVNNDTDETMSKVQLFDPINGIFPNDVLSEINYVTPYDPVRDYNSFEWYDNKVGFLWWDLSKVKYIDYQQSDSYYKRKYWGKQAKGSQIIINEWTKSTEKPESGNYVSKKSYNSSTRTYEYTYYYWAQNVGTIPDVPFRSLSANTLATIINDPTSEGIIWLAPCSLIENVSDEYDVYTDNDMILTNFNDVTLGEKFVIQMNFDVDNESEDYSEWKLIKENSEDEFPDYLWNKTIDCLVGMDEYNQVVPNPELSDYEKLGIGIRPRQTMFSDLREARRNLVDGVNNIFNSRDITVETDISNENFSTLFNSKDEIDSSEYDMEVENHAELETLISIDEDVIGKTILVKQDELYENIWTLWYIKNLGTPLMIKYEIFDTSKYWKYVDIYTNDIYKQMTPIFEGTEDEVLSNQSKFKKGDLIQINVSTTYDNYWKLVIFNDSDDYSLVAQENAGINLLDTLYTYMDNKKDLQKEIFLTYYVKTNDNYVPLQLTKYEYKNTEVQNVLRNILTYF